jgi:hypothetical protein
MSEFLIDVKAEQRGKGHRWRARLMRGVLAAAALYLAVAVIVSAFTAHHLTGEYWVTVAGITILIGGLLRWALVLKKRL